MRCQPHVLLLAAATGLFGCNRSPANQIIVPYPDSIKRNEVLANAKFAIRCFDFAKNMRFPELAGELRAKRILQVRSEKTRTPNYLVVELEDPKGIPLAVIALTRPGHCMGLSDCRPCPPDSRPLDLSDAENRVRLRRGGRAPLRSEYVTFLNVTEPGVSLFRPLVAVTTERGVVYFNTRRQAFAEEGSPVLEEFGGLNGTRPWFVGQYMRRLRLLGQW